MAKKKAVPPKGWFNNCGGWRPSHDMDALKQGISEGLLDEQDDYGMTALSLAVMSDWIEGVEELLQAGADTELRYYRTGETALYMAFQQRKERIVTALVAAGANPDASNYWGLTARSWAIRRASTCFDQVPSKELPLPAPRIQNAEHLADHYHLGFKIPDREERETMQVGQAVDLYVYGPKADAKQDTVKVRITARSGRRPRVRYTAAVETPLERTHLPQDTAIVEFGPENIASVYVPPASTKK